MFDGWKWNSKYNGKEKQKLSSLSCNSLSVSQKAVKCITPRCISTLLRLHLFVTEIQDDSQPLGHFSRQEGKEGKRGYPLPFKGILWKLHTLFLHINYLTEFSYMSTPKHEVFNLGHMCSAKSHGFHDYGTGGRTDTASLVELNIQLLLYLKWKPF